MLLLRKSPVARRAAAACLLAAGASAQAGDPAQAEVALPCADGWHASLVVDQPDAGIWTVEAYQVFEQYGAPELVGCDDEGRLIVAVSYSGKWTPLRVIEDGRWLGGLTHGDVDPRVAGAELYAGGQNGNLYQVIAHQDGKLDARRIAALPGQELHTLECGDLDPRVEGAEILVWTSPGGLHRVTPTGEHGTFESERISELGSRVRDAVVLPRAFGGELEIATVSRGGALELLRIGADGPAWTTLHAAPMGMGRVALAPERPDGRAVLYATRDDGVVLRCERAGDGAWSPAEPIYLGPQGMRGVVAGRFDADRDAETLAVFGYSGRVELLTRRGPTWSVETIFTDRDKGHWLGAGELDGRNGTDELFGSGYAGRIFLLARPPGYARPGVLVDPKAGERAPPEAEDPGPAERPPRIAVAAGAQAAERLSSLAYGGGFETKTLALETLLTRARDGTLAPGLAAAWRHEDEGRTLVLTLRAGASFHDGRPVDAQAVREHLLRYLGLPEHGWLPSHGRVERVVARSPSELAITCDRPTALAPELCAIHPCAVQGPGTFDREGAYVRLIGTGPYRFLGARDDDDRVLRYERVADRRPLELVRLAGRSAIDLLIQGAIDGAADGWTDLLPRAELARLAGESDLRVEEGTGGSVVYLAARCDGGATADPDVRRAVRAAIDRAALIERVELGRADPCRTWAPPGQSIWPRAGADTLPRKHVKLDRPLRLLAPESDARAARAAAEIAAMLASAGLPADVLALPAGAHRAALAAGAWDLAVEATWGAPYDPYLSLVRRFLSMPRSDGAADERAFGVDPRLAELARAATTTPEEKARHAIYARVQALIDDEAVVIPLYTPRRVAAWRPARGALGLGADGYRLDWRFADDP